MNNHYIYFLILAASFTGPLALSFDKKVAFYKNWKYLFPAMLFPALLYIAWDMYFTSKGVWSFNEAYITGINIINLPLEEVLFFLIVPYCCVFIYACIRSYFPRLKEKRQADHFLMGLAAGLIIAGAAYHDRYYTSWTFILNGAFIFCIYLFRNYFKEFDALSFLISYAVCLIPFLIVNGFLTAIPVVLYNDAENLGIRIHTIPVEDVFYGMLLVLMNIVIYEKRKAGN
ncbi:MAG: lycopene cyclase domain-containing protein [Ferruginibacter sp.]|nr:lycopene cyclase domain-containing protein [Ferruginibacter sp.]MBU9936104.1 lycopene cyclase domain-containing protein [Ferruginibacter sp.]